MKKKNMKKIIGLAVSAAVILAAMPISASAADDDNVYVTMNIPYNTFYAADINNDVEVDAVSSATERLWSSFDGTYFVPSEEGSGGTILGVSFPVAVSRSDYDKLTAVDNETADYYFTDLAETPSVYKTLTIDDNGEYSFSEVQGNVTTFDGTSYTLTSETVWGDYLFEFSDVEIDGTVYGIIVTADNGKQYGLRHLENIWKKTYEFSWSSGIKTSEAHGNVLAYDHYESIMGETISNVTYITTSGIYSYPVNQYIPVKTQTVITVEDNSADSTSTKVAFNPKLPSDYNATYSVRGLDANYSNGVLSYSNASAGSYTLTVSDSDGKYADVSTSFILSTDKLPVAYDNASKQIVLAANATEDDFNAYIKNLTNVNVDGTDYSASGHGAISIINAENGTIDLEAASRTGAIFDLENKDTFSVVVSAAGYPDLSFVVDTKTATVISDNSSKTTSSKTSSTASNTSSKTTSGTSSVTSPKTSDVSNVPGVMTAALLSVAVAAVMFASKKKDAEN